MITLIGLVTVFTFPTIFAAPIQDSEKARVDMIAQLGDYDLYDQMIGNDLRLAPCTTLQLKSHNSDNHFYITFSEIEAADGKKVMAPMAYYKQGTGENAKKIFCKDVVDDLQWVGSTSTVRANEVCQRLGCALTFSSSPNLPKTKQIATCQGYSASNTAEDNKALAAQQFQYVQSLCNGNQPAAERETIDDSDRTVNEGASASGQGNTTSNNTKTLTH